MGLLDDAIREHLDLKRRHGATESEVARQEAEALGPVVRDEDEAQESGSAPPGAPEAGPSLPYDRAAEAGLTGEPDLPSFEWHGSSTAEPEVPSFISPEPLQDTEPEPEGVDSPPHGDVVSGSTEAFDVAGSEPVLEGPEVSREPDLLEGEGALEENRSAGVSPEPALMPDPHGEAGEPETSVAPDDPLRAPEPPVHPEPPVSPEPDLSAATPEPAAALEPEGSFDPPPAAAEPAPPEPEGFVPAPGVEPDVSGEPPGVEPDVSGDPLGEPVLPPIERHLSPEAEDRLAETPPVEDETAFYPAPTEDDLAASSEPPPSDPVPGLGGDASSEPVVPPLEQPPPEDEATAFHPAAVGTPEPSVGDVEDLPAEPDPAPPQGGPLGLEAEDLPPEEEGPPLTAEEVVEEPPSVFGPGEPPIEESPIEEPFVAGEEEAWREAGEAPGDVFDPPPGPALGGDSTSEDLEAYPAQPLEADPLLEPADEPPLGEDALRRPAADAELATSEPPDASLVEPLDAPAESEQPLPADPEAARGFFDETAEYERPRRDEPSRPVDPDFED